MCIFCERAQQQLADGISPAQRREAEQCSDLQERRVRATIVTGFLGAGKTTFLNFILKSKQHGRKLGVIQNEFGSVSVDDQLMYVEKSDHEVVVMPNGCLCCRVRGDLVEALRKMAAAWTMPDGSQQSEKKLEGLIVECSGLSQVMPVAQTFFADPFVQAAFRLDGVVCVCDASNYERFAGLTSSPDAAAGAPEGSPTVDDKTEDANSLTARLLFEQLSLSNRCLLNKCDLVDSAKRDAIVKHIKDVHKGIEVVPCRQGKVNLDQVLNTNSFSLEKALDLDAYFLNNEQGSTPGFKAAASAAGGGSSRRKVMLTHVHEGFRSVGLDVGESEVNMESFKEWLKDVIETHGDKIVRIKGVLRVPGNPKRTIIQGVGGHIEMGDEEEFRSGADNSTRLVFIGQLDDELSAELRLNFLSTLAMGEALPN